MLQKLCFCFLLVVLHFDKHHKYSVIIYYYLSFLMRKGHSKLRETSTETEQQCGDFMCQHIGGTLQPLFLNRQM